MDQNILFDLISGSVYMVWSIIQRKIEYFLGMNNNNMKNVFDKRYE